MNKKIIAILGAAVISVGTIGGVVFASSIENNSKENQTVVEKKSSIEVTPLTVQNSNTKAQNTVQKSNSNNTNYNSNSANNLSKDTYQTMIKIMRDNGFKDAARYMYTGNYADMAGYMNNLSQEDYNKMIKIMNDNGYSYMAQRMQSIGREGMAQMHNSFNRNGSNSNGMMGGF